MSVCLRGVRGLLLGLLGVAESVSELAEGRVWLARPLRQ